MLRKNPLLGRVVALLLLGGYVFFLFAVFTSSPGKAAVSKVANLSTTLSLNGTGSRNTDSDLSSVQTLYQTADGGQTWQSIYTTKDYFNSLNCADARSCMMTGVILEGSDRRKDVVVASQDNARTWSKALLPIEQSPAATTPDAAADDPDLDETVGGETILDVSCPASTRCYTLGTGQAGNKLNVTTDGGQNWQLLQSNLAPWTLTDLACPTQDVCYASGRKGMLMTSTNGGQTWQTLKSGTVDTIFDLRCSSATVCTVRNQDGLILVTSDGGQNWGALSGPAFKSLSQLSCPTPKICYAFGATPAGNKLAVTQNAGQTWEFLAYGSKEAIFYLSCPSAQSCFAATTEGEIRASHDGGRSWVEFNLNPPTASQQSRTSTGKSVKALSCPTNDTCYILTTPEYKF